MVCLHVDRSILDWTMINFGPRSVKGIGFSNAGIKQVEIKIPSNSWTIFREQTLSQESRWYSVIQYFMDINSSETISTTCHIERKGFVNKRCVLFSPVVLEVILDGSDGAIKNLVCKQHWCLSGSKCTCQCIIQLRSILAMWHIYMKRATLSRIMQSTIQATEGLLAYGKLTLCIYNRLYQCLMHSYTGKYKEMVNMYWSLSS